MSHTEKGKQIKNSFQGTHTVNLHNCNILFFDALEEKKKKMHISTIKIQLSQAINRYFTRAVLPQS